MRRLAALVALSIWGTASGTALAAPPPEWWQPLIGCTPPPESTQADEAQAGSEQEPGADWACPPLHQPPPDGSGNVMTHYPGNLPGDAPFPEWEAFLFEEEDGASLQEPPSGAGQ